MSKGKVHIVSVSIPELPAIAAAALETGGLAEAVASLGAKVTVIVTFGDGSVYEYPNVPAALAVGVKANPGSFPTIRYWPGYHRVG
jgi:hypothetical protein